MPQLLTYEPNTDGPLIARSDDDESIINLKSPHSLWYAVGSSLLAIAMFSIALAVGPKNWALRWKASNFWSSS